MKNLLQWAVLLALSFGTVVSAGENRQADPICPTSDLSSALESLKSEVASSTSGLAPGLSIAWKCGSDAYQVFSAGRASIWNWGASISPETAFDAASLGKPITAFLAFKLIERGELSLDDPVTRYLAPEQIPEGGALSFEGATIGHLLSHTSGMPNAVWQWDAPRNKKSAGVFHYSGNGFMLLQRIIENISGQPFDNFAAEEVFKPLGMKHSSFSDVFARDTDLANGHVPPDIPGGIFFDGFLRAFVSVALVIAGLSLKFSWFRVRWTASLSVVALVAFSVVASGFVDQLGLGAFRFLLWFSGIPILLAIVMAAGVGTVLGRTRAGLWYYFQYARLPIVLTIFFAGFFAIQLSVRSMELVPVPHFIGKYPVNAASSLHSTPTDMVRFLDQFRFPTALSTDLVEQISTPVAILETGRSWGYGIGIEEAKTLEGGTPVTVLWQWGDNPGSQSLSIALPDQGISIVLMSNRWFSLGMLRDIARQLLMIDAQLSA